METTTWKLRLDEETGAPIHDTKDPLGCCERCVRAEVGRRSTRRPTLRYSTTAKSGVVEVIRHDGTLVATLRKDSLFGWFADVAPEFDSILGGIAEAVEGLDRREVLDAICVRFTTAWKSGEVR